MRLQFGSPLAASLFLAHYRSFRLLCQLSTAMCCVYCHSCCCSASLTSSLSLFSLLLPIAILHYAAIFHIRLSCDCGSIGWAFPLLFQLLLTLFIYLLFLPSPPCLLLPSPRFSTHISLGFSSFFVAFAAFVCAIECNKWHTRTQTQAHIRMEAGRKAPEILCKLKNVFLICLYIYYQNSCLFYFCANLHILFIFHFIWSWDIRDVIANTM